MGGYGTLDLLAQSLSDYRLFPYLNNRMSVGGNRFVIVIGVC